MSNENQIPEVKERESYIKIYRMQATGADGQTVRVSVPREVVEKEARRLEIGVKDFIANYRIQWLFNGFEGAWARFISTQGKENNDSKEP